MVQEEEEEEEEKEEEEEWEEGRGKRKRAREEEEEDEEIETSSKKQRREEQEEQEDLAILRLHGESWCVKFSYIHGDNRVEYQQWVDRVKVNLLRANRRWKRKLAREEKA